MAVTFDLICIFPVFVLKLFQHHILPEYRYQRVRNKHDDY